MQTKKRANFDLLMENPSSQQMQSIVYSKPSQTIKLIGDIPEVNDPQIQEILEVLSTPGLEQVDVVINTQGGDYDTQVMLYNLLKSLQATTFVKTIGISSVMSAGQIIYMQGSERIMSKYSSFMIHTTRLQMGYDSANNSMNFLSNHMSTVKRMIRDIFTGYLTEQELHEVCENGKDFYLNEIEQLERGIATSVGLVHPDGWMTVEFLEEEEMEEADDLDNE